MIGSNLLKSRKNTGGLISYSAPGGYILTAPATTLTVTLNGAGGGGDGYNDSPAYNGLNGDKVVVTVTGLTKDVTQLLINVAGGGGGGSSSMSGAPGGSGDPAGFSGSEYAGGGGGRTTLSIMTQALVAAAAGGDGGAPAGHSNTIGHGAGPSYINSNFTGTITVGGGESGGACWYEYPGGDPGNDATVIITWG